MRSNAGMANRQGDVDLCLAQVSVPPVSTLAWLALAPIHIKTLIMETQPFSEKFIDLNYPKGLSAREDLFTIPYYKLRKLIFWFQG